MYNWPVDVDVGVEHLPVDAVVGAWRSGWVALGAAGAAERDVVRTRSARTYTTG